MYACMRVCVCVCVCVYACVCVCVCVNYKQRGGCLRPSHLCKYLTLEHNLFLILETPCTLKNLLLNS